MTLLRDINNKILIYHPYQLGVYHDEAKIRALPRDKYIFWDRKNLENWKNCGAHYSFNNQHMKKISHYIFERDIGVVGWLKKIDG